MSPDLAPRRSTGLLRQRVPPGFSRLPLRAPAEQTLPLRQPQLRLPHLWVIPPAPGKEGAATRIPLPELRLLPERDRGEPAAVPDSGWLSSCWLACSSAARCKKETSGVRQGRKATQRAPAPPFPPAAPSGRAESEGEARQGKSDPRAARARAGSFARGGRRRGSARPPGRSRRAPERRGRRGNTKQLSSGCCFGREFWPPWHPDTQKSSSPAAATSSPRPQPGEERARPTGKATCLS